MSNVAKVRKMLRKENNTGPMPLNATGTVEGWNSINERIKTDDDFLMKRIDTAGNFELFSKGLLDDEIFCLLSKDKVKNLHVYIRIIEKFDVSKQVTLEEKNKEVNTKTRRDHTIFLNKVFSDAVKRVNNKYRSNISSRLSKTLDAEKFNDLELKDEHIKEAHKLLEEWQTYSRTEEDDINSKFLAMLEADKKKTNQNATSNNYDSQSENSANSQIIQNL